MTLSQDPKTKSLVWALPFSLADTKGIIVLFFVPLATRMFYFARFALALLRAIEVYSIRFPHSDIPGSQVATHLPGTFRRYAASFVAF